MYFKKTSSSTIKLKFYLTCFFNVIIADKPYLVNEDNLPNIKINNTYRKISILKKEKYF